MAVYLFKMEKKLREKVRKRVSRGKWTMMVSNVQTSMINHTDLYGWGMGCQ